ncbi:Phytocyanin domain [Arabidopsis suecica]|uniref:Phytocyanin domain n=1 Tax=Arabidopsis suecica TaxID=45249 RepID=A0A8T2AKF2_ARASU|nr:Phytocyanin domain [Arabidopsis suecica]
MKNTIMGLLIVALSLFSVVRATSIYEVGDSNGWTTTVGVDYYKTWSSSKTFYVGDVLIFQYNKTFHNLMEVSFQDFESCNPNSPLTTYQSQYEPVILNRTGHYYFICGVPGHCESGQKLDVLVMPASLENTTPIIQPNNASSSNPSPKPLEDPLEVLPVDDATIATLPYNAGSSLCVWSGLSMLSFFLLQTLVFL